MNVFINTSPRSLLKYESLATAIGDLSNKNKHDIRWCKNRTQPVLFHVKRLKKMKREKPKRKQKRAEISEERDAQKHNNLLLPNSEFYFRVHMALR